MHFSQRLAHGAGTVLVAFGVIGMLGKAVGQNDRTVSMLRITSRVVISRGSRARR